MPAETILKRYRAMQAICSSLAAGVRRLPTGPGPRQSSVARIQTSEIARLRFAKCSGVANRPAAAVNRAKRPESGALRRFGWLDNHLGDADACGDPRAATARRTG